MKTLMENLFALQKLEFQPPPEQPDPKHKIAALRKAIPAPILAHYDRMMARGKKGVALVRHGVCSECHITITRGTVVSLALGNDAHLCGNCNRYLYLPENESIFAPVAPEPVHPPKRKRQSLAAAA